MSMFQTNKKGVLTPFSNTYIAHRGLFQSNRNIPENSIPAFANAINAGFGIELDVQMTRDGKLVVFHDESLQRMCGSEKLLRDCTYAELLTLHLADSNETIPLFTEVLELVDGRVPLVIEIKSEGDWKKTTKETAKILDKYTGLFCIESFHPLVLRWFYKNRPDIVRGQLSTNYFKDHTKQNVVLKFLLTNLMLNILSHPDFVSYNHRWKKAPAFVIYRKLSGNKTAAWTIQSQQALDACRDSFQIFIFDGFIPK